MYENQHKAKELGPQSTKGVDTWDARWWFSNRTRWDHGGGHVALLIVTILDLVPNYVVLVLGNEGGGPHHVQGRHRHGLGIG
jgi:hypothetical protein